jgi:hypothetical protein
VEFACGAFRNSKLRPDQCGQASIRSSSWRERHPRAVSIIHAEPVTLMPQAGCSHHKQSVALSEHHQHHSHLTSMKSGPLSPVMTIPRTPPMSMLTQAPCSRLPQARAPQTVCCATLAATTTAELRDPEVTAPAPVSAKISGPPPPSPPVTTCCPGPRRTG